MRHRLVLLLTLLLAASLGCLGMEKQVPAAIGGAEIQIEIADTPGERAEGLMNRERLDENAGMLFVFDEEGYHAFWMKNMRFPLDILWLDGSYRVVHISANTPPCRTEPCRVYVPAKPAKYVLEVRAGFAREKGIETGDKVSVGR